MSFFPRTTQNGPPPQGPPTSNPPPPPTQTGHPGSYYPPQPVRSQVPAPAPAPTPPSYYLSPPPPPPQSSGQGPHTQYQMSAAPPSTGPAPPPQPSYLRPAPNPPQPKNGIASLLAAQALSLSGVTVPETHRQQMHPTSFDGVPRRASNSASPQNTRRAAPQTSFTNFLVAPGYSFSAVGAPAAQIQHPTTFDVNANQNPAAASERKRSSGSFHAPGKNLIGSITHNIPPQKQYLNSDSIMSWNYKASKALFHWLEGERMTHYATGMPEIDMSDLNKYEERRNWISQFFSAMGYESRFLGFIEPPKTALRPDQAEAQWQEYMLSIMQSFDKRLDSSPLRINIRGRISGPRRSQEQVSLDPLNGYAWVDVWSLPDMAFEYVMMRLLIEQQEPHLRTKISIAPNGCAVFAWDRDRSCSAPTRKWSGVSVPTPGPPSAWPAQGH